MKKTIKLANLVIEWSDGKTEELSKVLPEYLREELEVYFDELEDLREEHDAGLRDEPYHFEPTV
jgi:predicted DNA-binding protein